MAYIVMLLLDGDSIFYYRELKVIISSKKKTLYKIQSEIAYY